MHTSRWPIGRRQIASLVGVRHEGWSADGGALCSWRLQLCCFALAGNDNRYVAPPAPRVTVAVPARKPVTRYLEATGNTAAVNSATLVARVQGFLQKIHYSDGDLVKQGQTLFTIEPEPYKLKLEQAQAAEAGAQATLKQTEAEYERQSDLAARQIASKQTLDNALANRDSAKAKLKQAQVDTSQAAINLGYTEVKAPFDGIVTARLVSIGELVGAQGPTQLASIVQIDPIYVNFNISEQDVLHAREEIRRLGLTPADLKKIPVEVALQTDAGYPHQGDARLRTADRHPIDRNAGGARNPSQSQSRAVARLFRPRPHTGRAAAERAAGS